jgi:hypothetical protein
MAFVKSPDDEEDTGQEQPTLGGAPAPQQQAPGQATPVGAEPKGSGNFTNLNKFIDANAGVNGQAGKSELFAKSVTGEVKDGVGTGGLAGQGQGAFNTLQGEVKGAKDAMTLDTYNTPLSTDTSADDITKIGMGAGTVTKDEEAKYGKGFVSEGGKDQIKTATDLIYSTGKPEGVANVTSNYYNTNKINAGSGEKSFDTFLLGRDQGAKTQFGNLRKWAGGTLDPAYNNAVKEVGTYGGERLKEANALADKVKADAGNVYTTGYVNPLNTRIAEANDRLNNAYGGKVAELKRTMGSEYVPEVTLDGANYVTKGAARDWRNMLTPDQQARINALADIAGKGRYDGDLRDAGSEYTVDMDRYNTDVAGIQKTIDDTAKRDVKNEEDKAKVIEGANDLGEAGRDIINGEVTAPGMPTEISKTAIPPLLSAAKEFGKFINRPIKVFSSSGAQTTLKNLGGQAKDVVAGTGGLVKDAVGATGGLAKDAINSAINMTAKSMANPEVPFKDLVNYVSNSSVADTLSDSTGGLIKKNRFKLKI